MQGIIQLYASLLPVILAGVANSAFVKSGLLAGLARPLDGGRDFIDHRRILGEGKTYKGFVGYIALSMAFTVIWGWACSLSTGLQGNDLFYRLHGNTLPLNLLIGFLLGFAWALFELPNSFIKRRLAITSSMGGTGAKGVVFAILDQADSIFGVVLVLALFYPLSVAEYFFFVAVGAATHLLFNFLLYVAKLRKRPL